MVIYHGTIRKKNPEKQIQGGFEVYLTILPTYFSIKSPGLTPLTWGFFFGPNHGWPNAHKRDHPFYYLGPLASMYGVFTYIYSQKLRLNVGKYTILDEQLVKTSWKFSREKKCDMICKAFFLHVPHLVLDFCSNQLIV